MKIVNFFTPRFLRGIFLLGVFSTALCDGGQNDEVGMDREELMVKMSGRRTRLEEHIRKLKAKNGPTGERSSNDNTLCEDNANESLSRLFITTRDDVSSFLNGRNAIAEVDPFVRLVRECIANENEVLAHMYGDEELLAAAMAPNNEQSTIEPILGLGSCVNEEICTLLAEAIIAKSINLALSSLTSLPGTAIDVVGNTFAKEIIMSRGGYHLLKKIANVISTSKDDKGEVVSIVTATIIDDAGVNNLMRALAESPDLSAVECVTATRLTVGLTATAATGGAYLAAKLKRNTIDVAGVYNFIQGVDAICNTKCDARDEDNRDYSHIDLRSDSLGATFSGGSVTLSTSTSSASSVAKGRSSGDRKRSSKSSKEASKSSETPKSRNVAGKGSTPPPTSIFKSKSPKTSEPPTTAPTESSVTSLTTSTPTSKAPSMSSAPPTPQSPPTSESTSKSPSEPSNSSSTTKPTATSQSTAPSRSPEPPNPVPTESPVTSPPTSISTSQSPSKPNTSSSTTIPTASPNGPPPTTNSPSKSPSSSPEPPTQVPTESPSNFPTPSLPLVPAPSCDTELPGYICLQNQDFGVDDPTKYNFDLSLEVLNPENAEAYMTARAKWMEVIKGDLQSKPRSSIPPFWRDSCRGGHLPSNIDDLHICGRDLEIDGPYNILGYALTLWTRNTAGNIIPLTGEMAFDIADIERKVKEGSWESLILHEMGHLIGIGTMWEDNDLINNDLNYIGSQAIGVWKNDWGCSSNAPPVEKDGGPGTSGGHWDEDCLHNELMTGYTERPGVAQPLSRLTVASLEDIGYVVDKNAADVYDGSDTTCCSSGRSLSSKPIKPPPSDVGKVTAIEYGRQILSRNQPIFAKNSAEHDGNVHSVVVIFEENGRVHDVHVTA